MLAYQGFLNVSKHTSETAVAIRSHSELRLFPLLELIVKNGP